MKFTLGFSFTLDDVFIYYIYLGTTALSELAFKIWKKKRNIAELFKLKTVVTVLMYTGMFCI